MMDREMRREKRIEITFRSNRRLRQVGGLMLHHRTTAYGDEMCHNSIIFGMF